MKRETRFEYLGLITKINNEVHNQNRDLLTITGFFTTEREFLVHALNHTEEAGMKQAVNEMYIINNLL